MFCDEILRPGGYFIMTVSLSRDGRNNHARKMAMDYGARFPEIEVLDDLADWWEQKSDSDRSVVQRARGIAAYIRAVAGCYGQTLQILPPHVYYNQSGTGTRQPEASFCFRNMIRA